MHCKSTVYPPCPCRAVWPLHHLARAAVPSSLAVGNALGPIGRRQAASHPLALQARSLVQCTQMLPPPTPCGCLGSGRVECGRACGWRVG
eukprot:6846921-Alexandrium_andersonii.AAC.1